LAGIPGVNWAWHYKLVNYTQWHPFEGGKLPRFQIWDSHEIVADVDSWYRVSDVDYVMNKTIKSAMELIDREFDFSNREAFMKSLVLDDDDPRLDNMMALANVGITAQCILRILQGDYEFVHKALKRFAKNGGNHDERIPVLLNNLDEIKAHVENTD